MYIRSLTLSAKTLFSLQKRNILFIPKRKTAKTDTYDPQGEIDDVTYFKHLKNFRMESQGLPRNSAKYMELKKKHWTLMEIDFAKLKSQSKLTLNQQFLRFYFIFIPEDLNSYELISILNYNNVRFKTFEDSPVNKHLLKNFLGPELRSNYKYFKYPFMSMESSEEPTVRLDGFESILSFLIENKFIADHRTHSSYEKDGINFCKTVLNQFQLLFRKFVSKFNFYFRIVNFNEAFYRYSPIGDNSYYLKRIFSRIYRLSVYHIYDIPFLISHRKVVKEAQFELVNLLKEWANRLNNKPFHGGDVPDAADFNMHSMVKMYSKCRNIKKIIDFSDEKFKFWNDKMSLICQKDVFVNRREVTYNYSPDVDNKDVEQEKINVSKKKSKMDLFGAFGNKKRKITNI